MMVRKERLVTNADTKAKPVVEKKCEVDEVKKR